MNLHFSGERVRERARERERERKSERKRERERTRTRKPCFTRIGERQRQTKAP